MKLHEWFDNFDWDLLVSRQMDPPFKPKMQDLSQEILKAREENKDLSDQIRLEEKSDDPLIRNRKSKLSENWDWEF
jgi:cGMP-dependent protein kinase